MSDAPTPAYATDRTTRAHLRAVSHRHHPDDTWAAARLLYADGESGEVVRERFNIGRTAFYERMKKEGWRRRDLEAPDGLADDPLEAAPTGRRAIEVAADCWDLMCRAVDRGRLTEARGWGRLYVDLRRIARTSLGVVMVTHDADSPDSLFLPPEGEADSTDLTDSFSESASACGEAGFSTPPGVLASPLR